MKIFFIGLVIFYIFTLGFVIAWEGYRKQLKISSVSLVLHGVTASAIGLLINYLQHTALLREILLFDSINVGSGLIATGYGVVLGGILLGLLRLRK